jgi:hypothetical protein
MTKRASQIVENMTICLHTWLENPSLGENPRINEALFFRESQTEKVN